VAAGKLTPRPVRQRINRAKQRLGEGVSAGNVSLERDILRRLPKLATVWRPVSAWLLLMLLIIGCLIAQIAGLNNYYQTLKPVGGGIYTEGIIGSFTNANPVYATNEVDKTVSKLLFPGLFTYDQKNRLVGDLASSWSVDTEGKVYTVHLRPHLQWQDGKPLTAGDVAFTYRVIQNPDAQSPLQGSWAGIKVEAKDARTVVFTLPNPLASFIGGVTNGIIPEHLLKNVPMVGMRSSSFNSKSPVGAGPFMWRDIQVSGNGPADAQETIGLASWPNYYRGEPRLKSFVVHAFADKDAMITAYRKHQLTAMSGLVAVPARLKMTEYIETDITLNAATMAFFKTSNGVLADATVRKALVNAADPSAVIATLGYAARPVREPILSGQLAYDGHYKEQTNNLTEANQALDGAGWVRGSDGVRAKNGQKLAFTLTYADTPEYQRVADVLKRQWKAAGVAMSEQPLDDASLQTTLGSHGYDAILYGISIGGDPDVFVYWDSSQADVLSSNRLNLSEYKSLTADAALEAGRTRTDPALRIIKYQGFLQAWQQDAPALGLYQPRYLYLSHTKVYGLNQSTLNNPTNRLDNVSDWMIRTARVTNS
jgi:peptide/nickel transport system substrate-binding protein